MPSSVEFDEIKRRIRQAHDKLLKKPLQFSSNKALSSDYYGRRQIELERAEEVADRQRDTISDNFEKIKRMEMQQKELESRLLEAQVQLKQYESRVTSNLAIQDPVPTPTKIMDTAQQQQISLEETIQKLDASVKKRDSLLQSSSNDTTPESTVNDDRTIDSQFQTPGPVKRFTFADDDYVGADMSDLSTLSIEFEKFRAKLSQGVSVAEALLVDDCLCDDQDKEAPESCNVSVSSGIEPVEASSPPGKEQVTLPENQQGQKRATSPKLELEDHCNNQDDVQTNILHIQIAAIRLAIGDVKPNENIAAYLRNERSKLQQA